MSKPQADLFEGKKFPTRGRICKFRDNNWAYHSGTVENETDKFVFVKLYDGKIVAVKRENIVRIEEK